MGIFLFGTIAGCTSGEEESTSPTVYVGTGTDDASEGIYAFQFDPTSGALTRTQEVTPIFNPTYLTVSSDGEHLYSVSESVDSAAVAAYEVDASTGALSQINAVAAEGGAPCYISMDATEQWILTANYVGGNVAVFPVQDGGGIGPAAQVVQHRGSGANPDRQSAAHAHYFQTDPQNQFALASDLGIDQIRIYPFDAEQGRLDTSDVRPVSTPPGTGPRHLAFHPTGEYVYMVGELSGTVTAYEYNAEEGRLTSIQTVSTVPDDFEGAARSADIHVHPSGTFLYASNRGEANDIVRYSIDEATGRLSVEGRTSEAIQWPRNFAISPSGTYLLVANRRSDSITVFQIDETTGALTDTGQSVTVPSPTKIEFSAPASSSADDLG